MTIVGQERKTIINLERINFLNIEEAENNKFNILINYADDVEGIIATYESEERAKEVLIELLNQKAYFELYRLAPTGGREQTEILENLAERKIILDTYEMPEK